MYFMYVCDHIAFIFFRSQSLFSVLSHCVCGRFFHSVTLHTGHSGSEYMHTHTNVNVNIFHGEDVSLSLNVLSLNWSTSSSFIICRCWHWRCCCCCCCGMRLVHVCKFLGINVRVYNLFCSILLIHFLWLPKLSDGHNFNVFISFVKRLVGPVFVSFQFHLVLCVSWHPGNNENKSETNIKQ